MKKIKKTFSIILALALAFCLCTSVFAASSVPSKSDTATITVSDVADSGATVTAYQIVSATYGTYGLTGYSVASGLSISDIENITASEVTTIANQIKNSEVTLTSVTLSESSDTEGTYSASVSAGTWLVIVTGTAATVYNPMIVSAYYTDANDATSLVSGTVSAEGTYSDSSAYAKSSSVSPEKEIVISSDETAKGTSADIGDTVNFSVSVSIPDYSAAYTSVTYVFTDTLSDGLTAPSSITSVTVGGTEVSASDSTYTVSISGQVITITFASSYVLSNAGADVVINYSATVNENAEIVGDDASANYNTATIKYTNDPSGTTHEESDTVYVYSFALTDEIIKISGGTVTTSDSGTVATDNGSSTALSGAVFSIFTDSDCTAAYTNTSCTGSATTDTDGYVVFSGLEEGTYYITETSAPKGYYINDTVYSITISATYNDDGTLASYSIAVADVSSNSSASTTSYSVSGTTISVTDDNPTGIVNTTSQTLPSTGGMGIYVVICISVIIAAACVFVVAKKKKSSQ